MDDYGPETYGERVADVYDEWYAPPNTQAECDFLAELAAGGRALELGIGTGRVAIPLAARGIEVHGIDASPAMVAQLRAKPGGSDIPVVVGDMADVPVDGKFGLVFIVFNTFFMLTSQAEQIRCLRNVAAHLAPDGRFVLHAFVPDPSRIERGQDLSVREAGLDQRASRRDRLRLAGPAARHHPGAHHRGWYALRPRQAAVRVPARARCDGAARGPRTGVALELVPARAVHGTTAAFAVSVYRRA